MLSKTPKNELKSGRLWLTVICGICLLIFAATICHIMYNKKESLSGTEISSMMNVLLLIVSNVMTFYFSKSHDESENDKDRIITVMSDKTDIKEISKDIDKIENEEVK